MKDNIARIRIDNLEDAVIKLKHKDTPGIGELLMDTGGRAEVEKLRYRFADIESKLEALVDHLGIEFVETDTSRRHEVVKK